MTENPSHEAFDTWMNSFMAKSAPEGKLILCGPRFYWWITDRFDPFNRPKFRGNAHQRRKLERYYSRMWKDIGSAKDYFARNPAV